ncbi:3-oxoacyl-[acyl-carrier-protein] synthase, mitochondrial [Arctopsyche grandis]|uniref:3-oxoacyl-[acyl-carrier-protein] synthase, mitochondrial n=1 Tax=Arctopsyche grandis TaxID=121162 RepID=UPI00406D6662
MIYALFSRFDAKMTTLNYLIRNYQKVCTCKIQIHRTFSTRRVVVTGLGVVCPLGISTAIAWENALNGYCAIKALNQPEYNNLPCRIAATVPRGSNVGELNVESFFSKSALKTMAPSTILAMIASEEALSDAGWKPDNDTSKDRTGVTFGMGMIDLQDVCTTNSLLQQSYNKVSPYFIPRILPNMAAGQISIKYGFRGPNHSVSTACATGAHSIGDGFRFIKHNDADVMICGGTESCISPLAIAGFCRLRALSTSYNEDPQRASRPFDKSREGFVMGEGCAVLILEELKHAESRNAKIYAEILGYGLSGDASHITAPRDDGTGAILSMSRALKEANLQPSEIGYINAHATSTPIGDAVESRAIASLFDGYHKDILISSTKGAHGHLLGAAGSLETLLTVLACHRGVVPPTINLSDTSDVATLNYVTDNKQDWAKTKRRIALKNSFGFGGTNATLCIGAL